MKSGIYIIRTRLNNNIYVGSSQDIDRRWKKHQSQLKRHTHPNAKLQNYYNKYGEDSLYFEVLEYTEDLITREQFWIDYLLPYFNICPKAGSSKGRVMSVAHRLKMAKVRTGKKHDEETKAKISATHKGTRKPWARAQGKLTIEQVLKIKEQLHTKSCAELAQEYGVKNSAISKIKQGRTWKNTLPLH